MIRPLHWTGNSPISPQGVALRIGGYYVAFFITMGTFLPYAAVWLADEGFTPSQIATLFALVALSRLVAAPAASHVADRLGARRRPMIFLSLAAFGAYALFLPAEGYGVWILITLAFALPWAGVGPLGENTAMLTLAKVGLDYGRVRLWGSLAFMITAITMGRVVELIGDGVVYWMVLAGLALTAAACWTLPEPESERSPARVPAGFLLRQPRFLLFLTAMSLIQASHGFYYAFGTLSFRAIGLSDSLIGWLWATGVLAEILLFALGGKAIAARDPALMLAVGGLGGIGRWLLMGSVTDPVALFLINAMHAFSFGLTHLATMAYILHAVPKGMSATAQALGAAVAYGAAMSLASGISGPLFDSLGARGYWVMALVAGVGVGFAVALWRRGPGEDGRRG